VQSVLLTEWRSVASTHHQPVLADEVVGVLAVRSGDTVVDCTFGAGGHARRIAGALGPEGLYVAIDRDPAAQEHFRRFAEDVVCRTRFVRGNFATVLADLAEEGLRADAILLDLGVSSMQIDAPERGFSYATDAPLDMRMDPDLETSAADLIAHAPEDDLRRWMRDYGEERHAGRIAREIVRRRAESPIDTTGELVDAIRAAAPAQAGFGGGHPAKRVFQALRIAVNSELESLDAALPKAFELLAPGGRLAVISFHSLEDRRVKRFMRDLVRRELYPPDVPVRGETTASAAEQLTPRVVVPRAAELDENPRARSARMRAIRRRESPEASP
jgi:16S rRNA (cytosine1402-N4)-methyltransferase